MAPGSGRTLRSAASPERRVKRRRSSGRGQKIEDGSDGLIASGEPRQGQMGLDLVAVAPPLLDS